MAAHSIVLAIPPMWKERFSTVLAYLCRRSCPTRMDAVIDWESAVYFCFASSGPNNSLSVRYIVDRSDGV